MLTFFRDSEIVESISDKNENLHNESESKSGTEQQQNTAGENLQNEKSEKVER